MGLYNGMWKFWAGSFRRQLILGIIPLIAIFMTLIVFDFSQRQHTFLLNQTIEQTRSLAEGLAINATTWVLAEDSLGLDNVVFSHTKYPDLTAVMVISPLGEILAHSDRHLTGTFLKDEDNKSLLTAEHQSHVTELNNIISAAAPVMNKGQHIGWARVLISRNNIVQQLGTIKQAGIFYTLTATSLAVVLVLFLTRTFSRNLKHMTTVANDLRKTGKGAHVTIGKSDPMSALGAALNTLAESVQKRETELFHQREHLEEVVVERTQHLIEEIKERQSAEEKVTLILNTAVDGIITTDEDGVITSFNPAAQRIFGYSSDQIIGQDLSTLMPETGGKNISADVSGRELLAQHKNGAFFPVEMAISELKNETTHLFTGIVRDITERKQAEQKLHDTLKTLQQTQDELVQSEMMASLGGLVAGIAHEINTPIGVGVTAASALKERASDLEKSFLDGALKKSDFQSFVSMAKQSTDILLTNLHRASNLIRSFKQVAVDQSSEEIRNFKLLDYVDEILLSLRPKLKQTKLKVRVEGDRSLKVESYPGPIAQILTNLIMNSIIHAYGPEDDGNIRIHAVRDKGLVRITYSDDGKGMNEETASKIFEPFFTTRRGSGGSGLGMHILYNQITQTLGGTVVCKSVPGEGTTFNLTFPIRKGS